MEYKDFALETAKKAGKIIKANFSLGMKKEWKDNKTPITETDLAINKLLVESVNREFPNHGIMAEESESEKENAEYLWVCDPVDGTLPFSHGIPICTFSLALVKDGKSILGVAYDPFLERIFYAEKNQGAFMNNRQIAVSQARNLQHQVIDTEFSGNAPYRYPNLAESLEKEGARALSLYSVVYSGTLVASGELIGAMYPVNHSYDVAAIKIIVEEAGGKVTDLFGNESDYSRDIKGAIISNGYVHDYLLQKVQENLEK